MLKELDGGGGEDGDDELDDQAQGAGVLVAEKTIEQQMLDAIIDAGAVQELLNWDFTGSSMPKICYSKAIFRVGACMCSCCLGLRQTHLRCRSAVLGGCRRERHLEGRRLQEAAAEAKADAEAVRVAGGISGALRLQAAGYARFASKPAQLARVCCVL